MPGLQECSGGQCQGLQELGRGQHQWHSHGGASGRWAATVGEGAGVHRHWGCRQQGGKWWGGQVVGGWVQGERGQGSAHLSPPLPDTLSPFKSLVPLQWLVLQ